MGRGISKWLLVLGVIWSQACQAAESLTVYTENYPPYNMYNADQSAIIGKSTAIVKALFAEAGIDYQMQLVPWARALRNAKVHANTAVFSMARTPEREAFFHWIGPLIVNRWIFMARREDHIVIDALADIKGRRIGTYRSDISFKYLTDRGFDVDITSYDKQNAGKLKRKRIDLWSTGLLLGPYLADAQGIDGLTVVKTSGGEPFVFIESGMYLGINRNTPISVYQRLQQAFDAISDQPPLPVLGTRD